MDPVMIQGRCQRLLNLSHNVRQGHLLAWLLLKLEVCDLSEFSDSSEFPWNCSYFYIAYYSIFVVYRDKNNRIEHRLEYLRFALDESA